jgi:hypothetical protein
MYYFSVVSGLFLVAFYVMMVLICIPICYVQIKLGALFKRGIVGIFSILVPILKGKYLKFIKTFNHLSAVRVLFGLCK